jgi:hypothetical protein
MNWVKEVIYSIPPYAKDIATNLEHVIQDTALEELDAHACALAAACAISNGGLANAINMNGPLFGTDTRETAKTAAVCVAMLDIYHSFDSEAEANTMLIPLMKYLPDTKFLMYALSAAISLKSQYIKIMHDELVLAGVAEDQMRDIAKIAAVIAAINKIVV